MELCRVLNMCNLYVCGLRMLHKGHYVAFRAVGDGESGHFRSFVIYPDKMSD